MEYQQYLERILEWLLGSGLRILLVVILTGVALKTAEVLSKRFYTLFVRQRMEDVELQKRADTLASVVRYIMTAVIFVVSVMTILRELGFEIGPLLAAAGVVGLAIGFGAQNLVQDVISGFFIFLHDQIRVGDVVEIAGKGGLVESVNLKMTKLRDLAGNVHYVPNGQISVVTNMTKDFSRYVFNVGVAYRENVDDVMEVLREVDEELRKDPDFKDLILEPLEILGLDQFADSAVVIKARTTTQPIKQWAVGREFNRRLKKKFDERGIEIPFPHVTLYMGQDKTGQAPPLYVKTEGLPPATK